MLATQYAEIARDAAPQIARVLTIIAERRAHPVIVHCTAGKDRTGVLVAVLLSLLGVDDDTVVHDYALSAEAMEALRAKLVERFPEGKDVIEGATEVFSAAPTNISALLHGLRADYGSIEEYAEAAGAGPSGGGRRYATPSSSSRSTSAARAKSFSVSPPAEWVVRRSVTVSQRMSMSGWWSAASARAPTALTKARAPAKSPPADHLHQLVAAPGSSRAAGQGGVDLLSASTARVITGGSSPRGGPPASNCSPVR